jgi:hypothetical protein
MVPEQYRAAVRKEFTCPSTEYDDEWIDQIKKFISDLHVMDALSVLSKREERRSVGETAAKIRQLSAKQTALEDRLDRMIDKALKRLATLKTFKQVQPGDGPTSKDLGSGDEAACGRGPIMLNLAF